MFLGGVEIPFKQGLDGHSDADVLLHAIMDAILGSAALGDIGTHFPPGEPAYRNISSLLLLQEVKNLLQEKGYQVGNIDSTLVAQAPRLQPFLDEMRQNIAGALGINKDFVSVKATTTENLGFAGRGEGMAAYAAALIQKQDEGNPAG